MPSSKEYFEYVLEQMRYIDGITFRRMMGEYLFYFNGKLFGGVYDDRLMVKKTPTNANYGLTEGIPYPNAKPMYVVEDIDDTEYLRDLVFDTVKGL